MTPSDVNSNQETNITGDGQRFLCFSLGEEGFAIPLLSVKEVIAPPEITTVPQTPPYFLGIMNLRGQIISVMDLRLKLSIKPKVSSETAIIICDIKPNSIGIVVDSIDCVLNQKSNEISENPEISSSASADCINGVFRNQDKLVLVLDIQKILNVGDRQAIAKANSSVTRKAA